MQRPSNGFSASPGSLSVAVRWSHDCLCRNSGPCRCTRADLGFTYLARAAGARFFDRTRPTATTAGCDSTGRTRGGWVSSPGRCREPHLTVNGKGGAAMVTWDRVTRDEVLRAIQDYDR